MLLFKDIKQNYPVYILDTQEFSLIQGKATQVSFPRLEMNQKTGKTEMVVDVTIEANGKWQLTLFLKAIQLPMPGILFCQQKNLD